MKQLTRQRIRRMVARGQTEELAALLRVVQAENDQLRKQLDERRPWDVVDMETGEIKHER